MRDRQAFWTDEERGYSAIQGTKPQTIGYVLNDSPVGQAAWIVEKFRALSDVNGDVESKFTKDEMLTNVMVYWLTRTATSAARIYYEVRREPAGLLLSGAGRRAARLRRLPQGNLVHAAPLASRRSTT